MEWLAGNYNYRHRVNATFSPEKATDGSFSHTLDFVHTYRTSIGDIYA